MSFALLEKQFTEYWSKLTVIEKESLLIVARNYVVSREDKGHMSLEQYNKEIDDAMKEMDNGEFYSHEAVIELSKKW